MACLAREANVTNIRPVVNFSFFKDDAILITLRQATVLDCGVTQSSAGVTIFIYMRKLQLIAVIGVPVFAFLFFYFLYSFGYSAQY